MAIKLQLANIRYGVGEGQAAGPDGQPISVRVLQLVDPDSGIVVETVLGSEDAENMARQLTGRSLAVAPAGALNGLDGRQG